MSDFENMAAEDWGRVAVSLPGWRWMPGMLGSWRTRRDKRLVKPRVDRSHLGPWVTNPTAGIDPDDPATAGCLLAMLGGHVRNMQTASGGTRWAVVFNDGAGGVERTDWCASLGRACIAAAQALGRWPG